MGIDCGCHECQAKEFGLNSKTIGKAFEQMTGGRGGSAEYGD